MRPPTNITTQRLSLRVPTLADAPAMFQRYSQDAEVTRYLMWAPHQSIADTREWLERCGRVWQEESSFPWIITRNSDGLVLGMIEMKIEGHKASLGYVLARDSWGNGYMTEAGKALIDWAITQPQIWRVWAFCDVENTASRRVMEKLGMKQEGILRRWVVHPAMGEAPRDCYAYAWVRDEK